LEPVVARELSGDDADYTAASVFAPIGRATPAGPGQLAIGGRWPFASGCRHAEWFLNGFLVLQDDAPRLMPDGNRDWRQALISRSDAEIIDNWDVLGLRGTGSNDVQVLEGDMREPPTPEAHSGALWRLPFFTLAGIAFAAFALGVGRRALDEFTTLAETRLRAMAVEPIARDPAVQVAFARAEAGLLAARAFVFDAVGAVWDSACAGDEPNIAQRARLQLAAQQAMRAGLDAVDVGLNLAGAVAVSTSHPLQRYFRDLHTASQHAYFSAEALKRYARTRFEIAQPTFML